MNRIPFRALVVFAGLSALVWLLGASMTPVARAQEPKPTPPVEEPRGGEPRGGPERRGGRRGEGGPGMGIHQAMEQMKGELRKVEESIGDPARDEDTLRGLSRLIQLGGASLSGLPKNMAEIPAEGQAAHKKAFRRDLLALVKDLADIELAVLDGKNAQAAAMLKSKVEAARDAGHKKYGGDEDDAEPK